MKEVEESAGLLESPPDSDDEEVKLINGFDTIVPLSLQALAHITGKIFYLIYNIEGYSQNLRLGLKYDQNQILIYCFECLYFE